MNLLYQQQPLFYFMVVNIMHYFKGSIKLNKMTYRMLKYLEGQKSYEFLTDFVFATSREIGRG